MTLTRRRKEKGEAKMTMTMEMLPQIRQTLSEIDGRVPDALRVGLGFGNRASPAPAPGEDADFAAPLLQPLATTDDDDDDPKKRGVAAPAPALRLDWASCYVPRPRYDHDAHFGNADAGVLAVADGVGSYMKDGVDAAAFSRGLMRNAAAEVAGVAPGGAPPPHELLERAYEKTKASRAQGASTAVIVSLDGDKLKWACIGDSSFAVVRDGRAVFFSEPQQVLSKRSKKRLAHFRHDPRRRDSPAARYKLVFSFDNPPFQLSAKGGDRVADAKTYKTAGRAAIPVRAGDVVVVGTDGLFHNVLLEQLEGVVRVGSRLGFSPKNMADIIAGVAYERSREELNRKECRGKPDDITVVVALVVQSDA
ncbi:unnamed protein product [Urochloa decumbens]|uniref:Protein phosphatase n=1 Tax=Urochloa decumbens TaxID=240449 RepID=A0ABC8ZWV3_9POAL